VSRAERDRVLRVDVEHVDVVRELERHAPVLATVVGLDGEARRGRSRGRPAPLQREVDKFARRAVGKLVAALQRAAEEHPVGAPSIAAVDAKSRLAEPAGVAGSSATREALVTQIGEPAEDTPRGAAARPAIAHVGQRALFGARRDVHVGAGRVARVARDDVDDAVDGVGAPQRCAGTADDLDAIDVLEHVVDRVPEHAGEERRIDRPPVHHDKELVRRAAIEAARRHGPRAVVAARHVHAVGEGEGVGQRGHAGTADVLARDDRHGGGRRPDGFHAAARGRDVDLHQLLDREPLQVLRIRLGCGTLGGEDGLRQPERNRAPQTGQPTTAVPLPHSHVHRLFLSIIPPMMRRNATSRNP
jgi:hypothetical protein